MTTPQVSLHSRIESSPLYNEDLAPATSEQRTWGTYNFAALWVSMSVNILTYMLAASLIQGGMNWKQAVFTVFLGNCIVLAPMLLNSHPGARYGIPFPVFCRASFGTRGANIPALMRAFVETRIKPYYLHHGDLAPGTAHLRTTIARGQELVEPPPWES